MKKFLAVSIVLLMLLSGCKKSENKTYINGISFTAEISVKNKQFSLNGAIDKSGNLSATIQKPETIKELQVFADKEKVSIEYMGIKYENEIKDYPVSGIVNLIYSSLDGANIENNKQTGSIKGYDYELLFDEKGYPLKLSIDDLNLIVNFKNVQKESE